MMLDVHIFLRFSTSKCSYFALISYKTLRKKYLYSELGSTFSRIWTEYGEVRISGYLSVFSPSKGKCGPE